MMLHLPKNEMKGLGLRIFGVHTSDSPRNKVTELPARETRVFRLR